MFDIGEFGVNLTFSQDDWSKVMVFSKPTWPKRCRSLWIEIWLWIKPCPLIESYRWSDVKLVFEICLGEFCGVWICL